MPAIWPKGSCRPETPPRLGARLRSGRPPAHRRRRGRQCRGGSRRDESDFVAVASAAGFLIQIGSAPCAVSNHAAVASVGARQLRVPDGRRDPDAHPGSDGRLRNSVPAACGAPASSRPARVAQQIIDGIRDERFLITPRPEVITSSMAGPATTNADWPGCAGLENKRTLLTRGASPARRRSSGSRGRARGPRGASAPRARTRSARCHDQSWSASPYRLGETRGGRPAR